MSPHACFRVLAGGSRASTCTFPFFVFGLVIRTVVLNQDGSSDCPSPLSEVMSQHGCHFRFDGS